MCCSTYLLHYSGNPVKTYEANIQAHAAHSYPYARGTAAASAPARANATGEVHGNRISKVYQVLGCKGYADMRPASVVSFAIVRVIAGSFPKISSRGSLLL
jgi:hypothetical protein